MTPFKDNVSTDAELK